MNDQMTNKIESAAKRVFRFARSKTHSIEDAEDLSQEILLSLVHSAEKLPDIRNVDAWVTRICQFTWSNYFRRERDHWHTSEFHESSKQSGDRADEVVERDEHERIVSAMRQHVAFLNATYREVIVHRFYGNLSIRSISERLLLPEGTVKWYLHAAKRKLKEHVMNEDVATGPTDQIFHPVRLGVGHSGRPGSQGEPNSTLDSLLAQNIVYATFREALSVDAIAKRLGVGAPYIEKIIEKLEYSDLIVKRADRYRAAVFVVDGTWEGHLDFAIDRAERAAMPLHDATREILKDIKAVGFLGSHLDDDRLLWSLLPFYIERLANQTTEAKEYEAYGPPERRDGGKYIALAFVHGPGKSKPTKCHGHFDIYPRYDCSGIKTRYDREHTYSHQVDSYFVRLGFRAFDETDLQKLRRIAEITRASEASNELDRLYIAEQVSKGYIASDDGMVSFNFPMPARHEKERLDALFDAAFESINGTTYFEGAIQEQFDYWRSVMPDSLSDGEVRCMADPAGMLMLGCLEKLEREGLLRAPTDEERPALSTYVYEGEKIHLEE